MLNGQADEQVDAERSSSFLQQGQEQGGDGSMSYFHMEQPKVGELDAGNQLRGPARFLNATNGLCILIALMAINTLTLIVFCMNLSSSISGLREDIQAATPSSNLAASLISGASSTDNGRMDMIKSLLQYRMGPEREGVYGNMMFATIAMQTSMADEFADFMQALDLGHVGRQGKVLLKFLSDRLGKDVRNQQFKMQLDAVKPVIEPVLDAFASIQPDPNMQEARKSPIGIMVAFFEDWVLKNMQPEGIIRAAKTCVHYAHQFESNKFTTWQVSEQASQMDPFDICRPDGKCTLDFTHQFESFAILKQLCTAFAN